MVTLRRWVKAQEYEQSFWTKLAKKIEAGTINQLDWYQWKASQLERRLAKYVNPWHFEEGRILEIGSGPIGIINFLSRGQRFAVDPLEEFFKESNMLTTLRTPAVTYLKGTGENLPYPGRFFSVVIIDNVIDHTHSPEKVLKEINRVLDKNGLLYLAVNIRTAWGAMVHKLLATLCVDKGHPHTFTKDSIRNFLKTNHFTICLEEIGDYQKVKQEYSSSRSMREKIKAYTGISEFEYRVVCQKNK